MPVQTLEAQVTQKGHRLEGEPLLIRWREPVDVEAASFAVVDVKVNDRWVPIQLASAYLDDDPEVA